MNGRAGWILATLLLAVPAAAGAEEGCLPRRPASAALLAERFGLDATQEAWLDEALSPRGGRPDPAVARRLPGAGAELREAVEAALCPETGGDVEIVTAGRAGPTAPVREARGAFEIPGLRGVVRGRADRYRRAVRFGAEGAWGPIAVAAGDLRPGGGLGLLRAAAGVERGSTPLPVRAAAWRPTTSLEEDGLRGVAVRWTGRHFGVGGARVEGRRAVTLLELERPAGRRGYRLLGAGGPGGAAGGGVEAMGDEHFGRWCVEFSRSGASAWGAAWSARRGPWGLAGSAREQEAGFAPPLASSAPEPVPLASNRIEASWRAAGNRFARGAFAQERDAGADGWPRRSTALELEGGAEVTRDTDVCVLWRRREQRPLGGGPEGAPTTVRADVEHARSGWRLAVRGELRADGAREARLVSVRWGRIRRSGWELRGALAERAGDGPALPWYRRRAGGLYGWDELAPGVWVGGWARAVFGAWDVDLSVDARRGGWDAAIALGFRHTWSGRKHAPADLDPHRGAP